MGIDVFVAPWWSVAVSKYNAPPETSNETKRTSIFKLNLIFNLIAIINIPEKCILSIMQLIIFFISPKEDLECVLLS